MRPLFQHQIHALNNFRHFPKQFSRDLIYLRYLNPRHRPLVPRGPFPRGRFPHDSIPQPLSLQTPYF